MKKNRKMKKSFKVKNPIGVKLGAIFASLVILVLGIIRLTGSFIVYGTECVVAN